MRLSAGLDFEWIIVFKLLLKTVKQLEWITNVKTDMNVMRYL